VRCVAIFSNGKSFSGTLMVRRKEYVRTAIKHSCEGRVEQRREISDERKIIGTDSFREISRMPRRQKNKRCAYCGALAPETKDHVIPHELYPPSKSNSKIQRLTVPACEKCNNGWSDDEPHFRTLLTLAGEPNAAVRELWDGVVNRSLREKDGPRRLEDAWNQMRPIETRDGLRHKIYPASDERFLRVLRKIVRGLHYHEREYHVSDDLVSVDILRTEIPSEFLDAMPVYHREPEIFKYQFEVFDTFEDIPMSSTWLLTFFENRKFIASVWKSRETLREHTNG